MYIYFSVITGKLGTDELEEKTIDTTLAESNELPHYSSIESIKEDEECNPLSSFSVS